MRYGIERFSLQDRELARVHPLELWLVGYLRQHPGAKVNQVADAGGAERQEVYQWLFRSKARSARTAAFDTARDSAHETTALKSLVIPGALVPSYATQSALGDVCGARRTRASS
jgi:hypothetical protein